MNVAIIPARGGSRRIPRKNIRMFHGKPIIAYSIQTALDSKLFDRVIVTSDDEEIGEVAKQYGAEAWGRDEEFARDEVGTQEVVQHVLDKLADGGDRYSYACCIYATAPLMMAGDLSRGRWALDQFNGMYAMSVGAHPLRDAGQWYWGHSGAFEDALPLIDHYTMMVTIPEERICDINTPEDFERAEQMYAQLHGLESL